MSSVEPFQVLGSVFRCFGVGVEPRTAKFSVCLTVRCFFGAKLSETNFGVSSCVDGIKPEKSFLMGVTKVLKLSLH